MGRLVRETTGMILLVLAAGAAAAQTTPAAGVPEQAPILRELLATQMFQQRVAEYVALHRTLEGPLPSLRPTTDMEDVRASMRQLAARIVWARHDARQGDIITGDVARMFRRRIATCFPPEHWEALLRELSEDERGLAVPAVKLHVNLAWPEDVSFGFVPPQLLRVLPPLPPELQYRIIGRSLVLWDDHANLIVDFLPGAFTT